MIQITYLLMFKNLQAKKQGLKYGPRDKSIF